MGIVLSILQILGIILLVLLGIVVIIVAFVLFAPLSYQIEGDIHETKWGKARISWLMHLIRGRVSYEDDLIYGEFWIFLKKISFSYEFTPKETEKKEEEKIKKAKKKSDSEKENIIDKLKNFIEKVKDAYPRLKKILTDNKNKLAVVHLKKELFYLGKILLPKKSIVNAAFSTGSPDTTGQLCGVIACFPVMYQKGWSLRPDFTAEKAFFIGDFWGKGRLYVFQLVGIILRIIFDKNCRRLYTMINKFMKRIKKR